MLTKAQQGYHVQITARSDRDLTPEGIIQKVADASGAKYSNADAPPPPPNASSKPRVAAKPAFTPTQSSSVPFRSARRPDTNVDEDGWGADAPPVVRTQLEKVSSAYQPTKVNMRDLSSQKQTSAYTPTPADDRPGVVRGAYQPVGKVDISEIRRQAKESGQLKDERPEIVKGSYEPVGKVDIAAIKARSQKQNSILSQQPPEQEDEPQPSLAQRSAAFSQASPLTSMPKPKVVNKFGGSSTFSGTKAPTPGGFEAKPLAAAAPVGTAGRTFADEGGKTPAQIWAEKKARERGASGSGSAIAPSGYTGEAPVSEQKSGNTGWESGYTGKKWAPVGTNKTGTSAVSEQRTGDVTSEPDVPASPAGGIGSIRDRFSGAAPMGAPAPSSFDRAPPPVPEPETSTKPNRGIPMPGFASQTQQDEDDEPVAQSIPPPPAVPRSPTPETPERESSPIRVAAPISRAAPVQDAHDELDSPPAVLPTQSLNRAIPEPRYAEEDDEPETGPDPGRTAAQAAAAADHGRPQSPDVSQSGAGLGERARAEYDYDAQEDNEVSFMEGEILTDIQKVDPDWWVVTNSKGQQGLVPANYLQLIEDDEPVSAAPAATSRSAVAEPTTAAAPTASPATAGQGKTAAAMYDYEAGEDNELSFPENAVITNIVSCMNIAAYHSSTDSSQEFPDPDWWQGEYKGKAGLFPAAYVELHK